MVSAHLERHFFTLKFHCLQAIWFSHVMKVKPVNIGSLSFHLPSWCARCFYYYFGGCDLQQSQGRVPEPNLSLQLFAQFYSIWKTGQEGSSEAPRHLLSWAHHSAWQCLPHSEFLWQMCQQLILLPFSFSFFTLGAWSMARPDKNKFIRMQATESPEYIPVKGPLGKQWNHFNSFLSAVTRAFSRGEKSCFIVARAIFTVVKDFATYNDNTLWRAFQHL